MARPGGFSCRSWFRVGSVSSRGIDFRDRIQRLTLEATGRPDVRKGPVASDARCVRRAEGIACHPDRRVWLLQVYLAGQIVAGSKGRAARRACAQKGRAGTLPVSEPDVVAPDREPIAVSDTSIAKDPQFLRRCERRSLLRAQD